MCGTQRSAGRRKGAECQRVSTELAHGMAGSVSSRHYSAPYSGLQQQVAQHCPEFLAEFVTPCQAAAIRGPQCGKQHHAMAIRQRSLRTVEGALLKAHANETLIHRAANLAFGYRRTTAAHNKQAVHACGRRWRWRRANETVIAPLADERMIQPGTADRKADSRRTPGPEEPSCLT